MICPAFQSTYILDDSTRNAYFSYAWQLDEVSRAKYIAMEKSKANPNDTLNLIEQPKTDYYAYAGEKVVPWRTQKRTKYGIIRNVPYPIRNYRLRTAPMENVLAPEPLNNYVGAELRDSLGMDSIMIAMDSLVVDQPVAAEKKDRFLYGYDPSDNFNVEQQYYNRYYAQQLIDTRPVPKPAITPVDTLSGGALPDSLQTSEPFLKGLFKKKKKVAPEVEDATAPVEENTPAPEEEGNGG